MSVSLPDLIRAIRGQIPNEKCDLLEDLVQKLQKREVRLNRQEFLHKVRDIAGDDAPALRHALKQLAVERRGSDPLQGESWGVSALQSSLLGHPGASTTGQLTGNGTGSAAFSSLMMAETSKGGDGKPRADGENGGIDTSGGGAAPAASTTSSGEHRESCEASNSTDASSTSAAAPAAAAGTEGEIASGSGAPAKAEDASGAPGAASSANAPQPAAGAPAAAAPAPATSQPTNGQPQQQQQQQQRLEVAAAAVLVHAAGCKNPTCPVPHCNKMKKIHCHFLECTVSDCAICKKLKPLTYIHAKHCVSAPGEQCIIPYCSRAKHELKLLMQKRAAMGGSGGDESRSSCGAAAHLLSSSSTSASGLLQAGGLIPQLSGSMGGSGSFGGGLSGASTGIDSNSMNAQAQAHYLLVLAHVMKCPSANCTVPECAPTKALVTNHTRSCRAGDSCTYPRCALSKRLMRHHRECPDQSCAICLPLRRRLAAAKIGAAQAQTASVPQGGVKRKTAKRKKDEEDEEGGDPKKKRKDAVGGQREVRTGSKKRGASAVAASQEVPEAAIASEGDWLEAGFCCSVLFATGRRSAPAEEARGEWRSGIVLRAYRSAADNGEEMVYDVMMKDGKEEKAVGHSRCRMVCNVCLSDKRAFRPPPMFCEKCFTAIHQRWSYWEESGDEGGLKLCKRCFADIKGAAHPNRMLHDLAHRSNLLIENFVEKKEKDRPEYVDNWVQCDECHSWVHWTCGLYKGEDTSDDCLFFCETCRLTRGKALSPELTVPDSATLPEDVLSTRLQSALREELQDLGVQCNPVTLRVVSNVETVTKFDQPPLFPGGIAGERGKEASANVDAFGKKFPYRSKCILAFQHVDGHEVCFFAMYVQEYGSECPEPNTNRVYISYLDSVRYFVSKPEGHRTTVYHSILVNYLAYARELGFTHAHIWVSPPKQGDDYIFYAHPETMVAKRMGLLKLKEWYEKMLEVAKKRDIVVEYQDMQEVYKDIESIDDIPMFSGDHWAASIVNKMNEAKRKEKESGDKKKPESKVDAAAAAEEAALMAGLEGGAGPSGSKGGESKDGLLNQITEEMRSMRNHFIVVTLIELKKGQTRATIVDPVPLITNEFVDTRSAFLEKCQMYHWQFDELRNAQHSTLMLLYHLHGMHKVAKAKLAAIAAANPAPAPQSATQTTQPSRSGMQSVSSRSSKIEIAMHDWSTLLAHANEAAANQTWALPPDELFQRILAQINRSKRDILQEKYNACLSPNCSAQTRSVFIRVLKRIAESFMTCLLQMQSGREGISSTLQPSSGAR